MNEEEPGFGCLKTGYYFPLCYDAYHDVFWRVQQGPLDGHGVAGKPFSVMCISTDSLVLLPYTGGDKIGENNMCFYGLEY